MELRKLGSAPFWIAQIIAVVGVALTGWSWSGFGLAIALYFGRMVFITAGYHRYFSHRTFKTSRPFQFLLALGGTTAMQKGALWWASRHRTHHKYSDLEGDPHSARRDGLWRSHVGWFLGDDFSPSDLARLPDLARYPELVWLERLWYVPGLLLAVGLAILGGMPALLWGFFVSTSLLWHGTFTINSLAHLFGRRRYRTTDDSRNNWLLALITLGEGWHNNHHYYQSAANQGFYWWEIDVTYYLLRGLAVLGLVWDVRTPPRHVREDRGTVVPACVSAPLPTSSSAAPSSS